MHAVAWSLLVLLGWILALTVFLPLTITLTVNKSARKKFFAWHFVKLIGRNLKITSAPARIALFKLLKDFAPENNYFDVLEIGAEGANLQYYPHNVSLTVFDVNVHFEECFRQNCKKYNLYEFRNFQPKTALIQSAADMNLVKDGSMDYVVATYLHCSRNVDAVLRDVLRVLKPGGIYLFLDHACFPKTDPFGCALQTIVRPLWYVYGGSCILNKDNQANFERAGFSKVVFNEIELDTFGFYLMKHQVLGIARK